MLTFLDRLNHLFGRGRFQSARLPAGVDGLLQFRSRLANLHLFDILILFHRILQHAGAAFSQFRTTGFLLQVLRHLVELFILFDYLKKVTKSSQLQLHYFVLVKIEVAYFIENILVTVKLELPLYFDGFLKLPELADLRLIFDLLRDGLFPKSFQILLISR